VAEYNLTIRDLTGVPDFNAAAAAGIPDDVPVTGFDNLAGSLTLSPALMEKYFTAADRVLDRLFGTELSSTRVGAASA
jgi:hypothetical protein